MFQRTVYVCEINLASCYFCKLYPLVVKMQFAGRDLMSVPFMYM